MAAGWQQARAFDRRKRLGIQSSVTPWERAQLQVRAYRHVNVAIAVLFGDIYEGSQRRGGDAPADQPQPYQQAVGGLPRSQRAGAAVTPGPGYCLCWQRLAPVWSGDPFAGPACDIAAVAAKASRSSDSGSSGTERLPRDLLQWPPPFQSRVLCPSPSPLRVSPGITPGSLTPSFWSTTGYREPISLPRQVGTGHWSRGDLGPCRHARLGRETVQHRVVPSRACCRSTCGPGSPLT